MDEAQFRDLYQDSFDRLVGQLGTMTGSFTEAQDCVQEAFVRDIGRESCRERE